MTKIQAGDDDAVEAREGVPLHLCSTVGKLESRLSTDFAAGGGTP